MNQVINDKEIHTQAKALLAEQHEGGDAQQTIAELRTVLRFADFKYYVESEPFLADFEYDQLFKKLQAMEANHPELITPDSPTQRVARGLSEKFPPVSHLVPMLSLDNTYNAEDLRDWDRRCRELAGSSTEPLVYCVEPKYDGASISVIYEDGQLTRGATRGDGVMGEEITPNVRQIKSIPLSAAFEKVGVQQIEIRGEVLIHKEIFAAFNEQRLKEGLTPLANPRNAASGTLRMLDPEEVRRRKLSAVLYHISDYTLAAGTETPEALKGHYESLQWLSSLGFSTPVREMQRFDSIDGVIDFCAAFEEKRDALPYEVDGLVIKVNSIALQEQLGMTSHHPRWAVAYKFSARQATSKLRGVEFQVGRTGSVTPVAKIDPVPIGGVTVASVSLFNEDVVKQKDLKLGDTVLVERAGDVIPYIVKSLPELRDGSEGAIHFPTNCPVCEQPLEKPEEETVWRCINANCPAQVAERLIHFCSKNAMDIRGMGDANVRRFYEDGLLTSIPGIYSLDWLRISAIEGFGKKSVDNLQAAIEKSKEQPLHRLIFGLGIRHVGQTTAKTLARAVSHLRDLYDWTEEQLLTLQDVGPKVAASIVHFFQTPENRHMTDELEEAGVNLKNDHKEENNSGEWSGKTFLFTGTLSQFKRSEAEEMVTAKGGTISGSVSSKLNYLVVGTDAGSKLDKAKKLGTVRILNEAEFLELMSSDVS